MIMSIQSMEYVFMRYFNLLPKKFLNLSPYGIFVPKTFPNAPYQA